MEPRGYPKQTKMCQIYRSHRQIIGQGRRLVGSQKFNWHLSIFQRCIILLFVTECQIVYIHLEYDSSPYPANALMFFCQCYYKFSVEIKFMAITQSMAITQGTSKCMQWIANRFLAHCCDNSFMILAMVPQRLGRQS